jgi:glycosyltransferase involved in cell wall biosynthesis
MVLPGVDAPPYVLQPYTPGEKFVMGHFGSLSETRNLVPVIAALDLLLDQQPDLEGLVELHVYGGPLDRLSAVAVASARRCTVKHFGRIEADPESGKTGREQILQRMRSADVLLLLHGIEPICAEYIPSKMYEYLWMQRPILALVHQNPQMEEILQSGGHTVISTNLANTVQGEREVNTALSGALGQLCLQWRTPPGLPDTADITSYTTRAAVDKLLAWVAQNVNR